jgi:hypothetical protein
MKAQGKRGESLVDLKVEGAQLSSAAFTRKPRLSVVFLISIVALFLIALVDSSVKTPFWTTKTARLLV